MASTLVAATAVLAAANAAANQANVNGANGNAVGKNAPGEAGPPRETTLGERVKKVVAQRRIQGRTVDEDSVMRALKVQFKEYRKSNEANLRKGVSRALSRARTEDDETNDASEGEALRAFTPSPIGNGNNINNAMTTPGSVASQSVEEENAATSGDSSDSEAFEDAIRSAKRPRVNALSASVYNLPVSQQQQQQQQSQKQLLLANGAKGAKKRTGQDAMAPGSRPGSAAPSAPRMQATRPEVRYADVGGLEPHVQELRELCEYPLTHPEIYTHLGVEPPRGVLLHGPPGCGKTLLANAIAGELDVPFFKVSAPEIVSGMSGESEEKVRALFQDAARAAPSIIFIDEVDSITTKRETSGRGMELRIVAQLLTCMDSLGDSKHGPVLVLGATNRPDALDSALRRAGRFDREIELGIPDEDARERVLRVLVKKMRIAGDFDYRRVAHNTPGFVGADLAALTKEAAVVAVNRIFHHLEELVVVNDSSVVVTTPMVVEEEEEEKQQGTTMAVGNNETRLAERSAASSKLRAQREPLTEAQLAPLYVTMQDFETALPKVQPSSKREGFATVPSVTWDDVGALRGVREELTLAISEPIRRPDLFRAMGLTVPAGVLLFGPPGCGKTLVAKAIASGSGANFISIKGPELLNKYVGESERAVRQVFTRARASAPCVVFFDELDALCPRRGGASSSSESGVSERVVNQLLTEMDGLEARKNIFVIGATNRPELIDPAMLRPGRLDRLVYVPFPTKEDREAILKTCARHTPLAEDVSLAQVAALPRLEGFSGADLAALVREAAVHALTRSGALLINKSSSSTSASSALGLANVRVTTEDFAYAATRVAPSVSPRDREAYGRMKERLASIRSAPPIEENADSNNTKKSA